MKIEKRSILRIYLFSFFTFGIYMLFWLVRTKEEINSLGAEIPTAWLLVVPIANLYWMYRYAEGFSVHVRKDNNPALWFVVDLLAGIIMPAIVQGDLNRLADAPVGES